MRSARFAIEPASAYPASVPPGGTIQIPLRDLGATAIKELLQSKMAGSSFAPLFTSLLVAPHSRPFDFVWREDGPGRGVEMKRAVSALFGRFLARWYLTHHHGFRFFHQIDGSPDVVSKGLVVRRTANIYLPDWIGAANGQVQLAEAKGSYDKAVRSVLSAQPLKKALRQLTSAEVWMRGPGASPRMTLTSVKGWGVMSRWGTVERGNDPLLYVLDPDSPGEPRADHHEAVDAVARSHLSSLLAGMGQFELADKVNPPLSDSELDDIAKGLPSFEGPLRKAHAPAPRPSIGAERTTIADQLFDDKAFVGAIIDSSGTIIPERVSILEKARATMPSSISSRLYYVGIDAAVLEKALDKKEIKGVSPAATKRSYDGEMRDLVLDGDGFVLCPLAAIGQTTSSF